MLQRMQHPDHGFMYAVDKSDFERLVKLGWAPEAPQETPQADATPDPEPAEPKRRGRPPKA